MFYFAAERERDLSSILVEFAMNTVINVYCECK